MEKKTYCEYGIHYTFEPDWPEYKPFSLKSLYYTEKGEYTTFEKILYVRNESEACKLINHWNANNPAWKYWIV